MTRDDIIRMARETGIGPVTIASLSYKTDKLTQFAALVAAAEREQCALLCEDHWGASECADAIRARG